MYRHCPHAAAAVAGVMMVLTIGAVACRSDKASPKARAGLEASLLEALDRGALDAATWQQTLDSRSVELERLAATVLASSADPASVPRLVELAGSAEPEVWEQILVAAGRIGNVSAGTEQGTGTAELVLQGLAHESPQVRRAAAWAACHLGGAPAEALVQQLGQEQDVEVLAMAAANLWRLEKGTWEPIAAGLAGNAATEVRQAAAASLARSADDARLAGLLDLIHDDEPRVRAIAVAGLARGSLPAGSQSLLLEALGDADRLVRIGGLIALAGQPALSVDSPGLAAAVAGICMSGNAQEAAAAIDAVAAHPEIPAASVLDDLVAQAPREPWLAGLALGAQVRRGMHQVSPGSVEDAAVVRAAQWLESDLEWRRRAGARALAQVEAPKGARARALSDPSPGVRLAWLEALPAERVAGLAETLRGIVESDDDPAARAQALSLLGEAQQTPDPERLLELYRLWQEDEAGDARAEALLAAMRQSTSGARLEELGSLAQADRDAGVRARVVPELRTQGVRVGGVTRDPGTDRGWYDELVEWRDQAHWLDLVTARGTVRVELEPGVAPITSRRIWDLAEQGLYDGLTFHRVVPSFVVQGGDPRGDGWGGPGFVLPDEPSLEPFETGAVGIATAGPNTGGCQLFAMLMAAPRLDAHYTRLGHVARGAEVLERIRVGDRILRVETASGAEPPPPAPVLLGRLEWSDLEQIDGWAAERDTYQPDPAAIEQLRSAMGRYRALSVLGTWCSDSRREVPRLQAVAEASGGVLEQVLIGVDRTKMVDDPAVPEGALVDGAAELVPTIIFIDETGQELGRVIETAQEPLERLLVKLIGEWEGW